MPPPYPAPDPEVVQRCEAAFVAHRHNIGVFGNGVRGFFAEHPELATAHFPAILPTIHSVKYRLKDVGHLRAKIVRKKVQENRDITAETLFQEVTDLAGVRVLHLHTEQFVAINEAIQSQVQSGHWFFYEPPKAYTWDPDSVEFYRALGLETLVKASHYTSVHYVVKPNDALPISCEIQVRTLMEEVWGEIEHAINYPEPSQIPACTEELRVLAKMVGASTRLCETIFRSHRRG